MHPRLLKQIDSLARRSGKPIVSQVLKGDGKGKAMPAIGQTVLPRNAPAAKG